MSVLTEIHRNTYNECPVYQYYYSIGKMVERHEQIFQQEKKEAVKPHTQNKAGFPPC